MLYVIGLGLPIWSYHAIPLALWSSCAAELSKMGWPIQQVGEWVSAVHLMSGKLALFPKPHSLVTVWVSAKAPSQRASKSHC